MEEKSIDMDSEESEVIQKIDKRKTLPQLFKPGQSGNPNGRPPGTLSVVHALKEKLKEIPPGKKKTYLDYLVEKVIKKGIIDGDVTMLRDVINRIDGLPKQTIDVQADVTTQKVEATQEVKEAVRAFVEWRKQNNQ